MSGVTRILNQIESGDSAAAAELLPLVYDELRSLARQRLAHKKPGQTLQATALVHEAYLRLIGSVTSHFSSSVQARNRSYRYMDNDNLRPPNSVNTTSSSFLMRMREGDEVAWRTLLDLYGPIVAFWAGRSRLTYEDTKDVCQDVFAAVARNIERFQHSGRTGRFRRWLKVITLNKINDHFRRAPADKALGGDEAFARIQELVDPVTDELAIDSAPDLTETENAAIVQGVLRIIQPEFHENTWKSFWQTAVEGKAASAAAHDIGLSPEAVRQNKSRVMARLREALSEHLS